MRCPHCGDMRDRVIDSRSIHEGDRIRRRRQCLACKTRYTTYESVEQPELRVIKRNGNSEPFHRYKLLNSILKACEKRSIELDNLERLVDEIVNDLNNEAVTEIPSRMIGLRAMEKLHTIDPVAYVRFASIYRQFKDVGEFVDEIEKLRNSTPRSASQPDLFPVPPTLSTTSTS